MEKVERRPVPDGRMRIKRILTANQLKALRALRIDGLIMFNCNEIDFNPPETWIEYWFDNQLISEADLRILLEETIQLNKE